VGSCSADRVGLVLDGLHEHLCVYDEATDTTDPELPERACATRGMSGKERHRAVTWQTTHLLPVSSNSKRVYCD
jgi:hypothetical protein